MDVVLKELSKDSSFCYDLSLCLRRDNAHRVVQTFVPEAT